MPGQIFSLREQDAPAAHLTAASLSGRFPLNKYDIPRPLQAKVDLPSCCSPFPLTSPFAYPAIWISQKQSQAAVLSLTELRATPPF